MDPNPLVQLIFTCPKIEIFLISQRQTCYGYSLEATWWGTSNECPQHTFSLRSRKNIYHNFDTLFSKSYEVLVSGQVNWNFLLFLRKMGQVGQVGHGISTALHLGMHKLTIHQVTMSLSDAQMVTRTLLSSRLLKRFRSSFVSLNWLWDLGPLLWDRKWSSQL